MGGCDTPVPRPNSPLQTTSMVQTWAKPHRRATKKGNYKHLKEEVEQKAATRTSPPVSYMKRQPNNKKRPIQMTLQDVSTQSR